jgi:hypothetical protein
MDLNELFGEDLAPKIKEKLGDKHIIIADSKDAYVPKTRLDEVINQRDEFKVMNSNLSASISNLEKSATESEQLKVKLKDISETHAKVVEEYNSKLSNLEKSHLVESTIQNFGVKNPKVVKSLIDMSKVSIDNGNPLGLTEQLEALKQTDDYLFIAPKQAAPNGDVSGGKHPSALNTDNPFMAGKTFSLMNQMILMKENPTLAEQMQIAASVK